MLQKPKVEDYGITQEDVDKQSGYKSPSESFTFAWIFGVITVIIFAIFRTEIYEFLDVKNKDILGFIIFAFLFGVFGMMIGGTLQAVVDAIRAVEPLEIKVNKYLRDKETYDKQIREIRRAELEKQERMERAKQREKKQYWYSLIGKGVEFEDTLAELFKTLGYEVRKTSISGDTGVDLILNKDGKIIIVQCKAHKAKVGQPIIRELYGTMVHFKASKAILATINGTTKEAKEFAKGKPIKLLTLYDYVKMQEETKEGFQGSILTLTSDIYD